MVPGVRLGGGSVEEEEDACSKAEEDDATGEGEPNRKPSVNQSKRMKGRVYARAIIWPAVGYRSINVSR